jgi:hypothetical protein
LFWGAAAAGALFAAHLAFIATESCARRSGVIWRFFFTSLKEIRRLAPAGLGAVFSSVSITVPVSSKTIDGGNF